MKKRESELFSFIFVSAQSKNVKLDSLLTHRETMSLSLYHQYK